ncbi:MAG TPA: DUF6328 family protein [Thermomicrobiales bacterium]|nr:DUF6328 family protein [Thermomicrobiales bacterium]
MRGDAPAGGSSSAERLSDGDLSDLLSELRVLLPGAQTLTAFLIILPFSGGFAQIQRGEKYIYVTTFLCALASLILLSAPAAQHRMQRPLLDREGFKTQATRLVVIGMAFLALALVLATQLVLNEVLHLAWLSWLVAGAVAILLGVIWWLVPLRRKTRRAGDTRR